MNLEGKHLSLLAAIERGRDFDLRRSKGFHVLETSGIASHYDAMTPEKRYHRKVKRAGPCINFMPACVVTVSQTARHRCVSLNETVISRPFTTRLPKRRRNLTMQRICSPVPEHSLPGSVGRLVHVTHTMLCRSFTKKESHYLSVLVAYCASWTRVALPRLSFRHLPRPKHRHLSYSTTSIMAHTWP